MVDVLVAREKIGAMKGFSVADSQERQTLGHLMFQGRQVE